MSYSSKGLMFENRLRKVNRHLGKIARKQGLMCYRIYDNDVAEFPVCIERYGERVYVAEYRRNHPLTEDQYAEWQQEMLMIIKDVLEVDAEDIFLKLRQRKENRQSQYQKVDERLQEFVVEENGLKFLVNLSDYLDTGLFLDHRITRQLVRESARHKRVLNLFAYTGSFSVYAAAGGASQVDTVDLSKTYLSWAERNLQLNGFGANDHPCIHADVLQWLDQHKQENIYDLIVMDPPTFSNSKRMEEHLDIQADHVELINNCIRLLKPGGVLYFSTNYRRFQLNSEAINSSSQKDITKQTTPFDFEGKLFRYCFRIIK